MTTTQTPEVRILTLPPQPLYKHLGQYLRNYLSAKKRGQTEFMKQWEDHIRFLEKEFFPHGSGLDGKVFIDLEKCKEDRLVIFVEYHHMNETGFYTEWTAHEITVFPTFTGIDMRISGRDKNSIKDYLFDLFYDVLMGTVSFDKGKKEEEENCD